MNEFLRSAEYFMPVFVWTEKEFSKSEDNERFSYWPKSCINWISSPMHCCAYGSRHHGRICPDVKIKLFKKCCLSNAMDRREDEKEVVNVSSKSDEIGYGDSKGGEAGNNDSEGDECGNCDDSETTC